MAGLFVDGVGWDADFVCPALNVGQGVGWEEVRCGKIESRRRPGCGRRSGEPLDKVAAMRGVITMLPALTPTQAVSGGEGRRSARPGAHPVAEVGSVAAVDQEHIGPRTQGTQRSADGGQRNEFRAGRATQPGPPMWCRRLAER